MKKAKSAFLVAALVSTFVGTSAWAQAPTRVRGTIEKVDGDLVTVKGRDGAELKLKLKDNATVRGVVKKSLADIKPGSAVGITSAPQADGSLKAIEVHFFPEGAPFNSFHGDWDLQPNTFMTNGPVQQSVVAADGQTLTVQYKVGDKTDEKKITVTPQTIIVGTVPGSKADLKPGLKVFVAGAPKLPDGSLDVANITVEKELPPPQ
jgi:hypothetical protein